MTPVSGEHGTEQKFLLTRPLRDVTVGTCTGNTYSVFLLTRPLRDVTGHEFKDLRHTEISTHTPLAGRD